MITLNPVFEDLYTTKKRYVLVTGGRGSGKSTSVNAFIGCLTFEHLQKVLFTRYTMTTAETTIIPEFIRVLELMECQNKFEITKTHIKNKFSKSTIDFMGVKTSSGNQTANMKGHNATTFVMDEMEEWRDEEAFDTLNYSIRSKEVQNRIIMVMNPCDTSHFIYKRFIQNTNEIKYFDGVPIQISTHPDVCHIHTTYLDNEQNLSVDFLKQISDDKINRPYFYEHKIIGKWSGIAEGSIFPKAKLKLIADEKVQYEASLAYIDVADEGTDYTCMFIGKLFNKQIHIVDVIYSNKDSESTIPLILYSLKQHQVKYCRVESNSMGGVYKKNLEKQTKDTVFLPCSSTTNKHTRIYMDSNDIVNNFYFSKNQSTMYMHAIENMCMYTNDESINKKNKLHDDAPDAASGLMTFYRSMFKSIF